MVKKAHFTWSFVACIVGQLTIAIPALAKETLRVLLYPYVPDRLSLFQKIEGEFEKANPEVDLQLVDNPDLVADYYSGGLQKASADVYEVDTILLSDLIQLGKISKIDFPKENFSKEAIAAVTRNGETYAVPHWLCGNFLFYRKGDTELASAKTWNDVSTILKQRNEALFVDLKGSSTLGEWYFTVLSELVGVERAQQSISQSTLLNSEVTTSLTSLLGLCPDGFCRSNDLHDRTGYYSRAFIARKSSAYIGYSESIHYGIQYALDNCTSTSGCLSINDIAVRRLPPFRENSMSKGVGWVDGLAVDSSLTGQKRSLAISFINYLVSEAAYKTVLEPEWMEAPKYLLPARLNVQISGAPLYPSFLNAHSGRETGTLPGLNNQLRKLGKQLDCALPIDRSDIETQKKCQQ
ncbi:hypothetical protein [Oscillatoria sp. FACHB-1406]|uniref:hypothetical protein n=1 Tax=Oscillatoria sp. FACHB-1406 TaxID=2692846 RepID=UPI00168A27E8|nr:hypothetical protein [Oscillatoria sp. FACHB-1406]MBD2579891.1 hypothetical protein [Oscillatoria sp. FACHB-1406]